MTSQRKRLTKPKGLRREYFKAARQKQGQALTSVPTAPCSPPLSDVVEPLVPLDPLIANLQAHLRKCKNDDRRRKGFKMDAAIGFLNSSSYLSLQSHAVLVPECEREEFSSCSEESVVLLDEEEDTNQIENSTDELMSSYCSIESLETTYCLLVPEHLL